MPEPEPESVAGSTSAGLGAVEGRISALLAGCERGEPFQLEISDPLGLSFVSGESGSLAAEEWQRSDAENLELGKRRRSVHVPKAEFV